MFLGQIFGEIAAKASLLPIILPSEVSICCILLTIFHLSSQQVPKKRPPTRWEQYANLKGIQNKKKSRKVWDDEQKVY